MISRLLVFVHVHWIYRKASIVRIVVSNYAVRYSMPVGEDTYDEKRRRMQTNHTTERAHIRHKPKLIAQEHDSNVRVS